MKNKGKQRPTRRELVDAARAARTALGLAAFVNWIGAPAPRFQIGIFAGPDGAEVLGEAADFVEALVQAKTVAPVLAARAVGRGLARLGAGPGRGA